MRAAVQHARQEWEESSRRLEAAASDRRRHADLTRQVDVIVDELRRRVGGTFTLAELVAEYGRVERWGRDAVAELEPAPPAWPRTLTLVEAAAFHLYARGAVDYEP